MELLPDLAMCGSTGTGGIAEAGTYGFRGTGPDRRGAARHGLQAAGNGTEIAGLIVTDTGANSRPVRPARPWIFLWAGECAPSPDLGGRAHCALPGAAALRSCRTGK